MGYKFPNIRFQSHNRKMRKQEKFGSSSLSNKTSKIANNPSERIKIYFLNNSPVYSEEAKGNIPGTSADQISNSSVGNLNDIVLVASTS